LKDFQQEYMVMQQYVRTSWHWRPAILLGSLRKNGMYQRASSSSILWCCRGSFSAGYFPDEGDLFGPKQQGS